VFADRVEVWNPGVLPPPLTPERLREPHSSLPRNARVCEALFLARYIEKYGTGTLMMIRESVEHALPEPDFQQRGGEFVVTVWRDWLTEQVLAAANLNDRQRIAALKPTNIGVPEYRDAVREYLEIAVLTVALRPAAKPPRLIELIHRAIPYPVVLVAQHGDTVNLSLAHKRWSQGETGKTVLDGEVVAVEWNHERHEKHERDFLAAMALARQPRTHLSAVYQGWIDRLNALSAARITGAFAVPATTAQAAVVREGLETYDILNRRDGRVACPTKRRSN
jgi:hypothetical protein